jgi:hypothetical protein
MRIKEEETWKDQLSEITMFLSFVFSQYVSGVQLLVF